MLYGAAVAVALGAAALASTGTLGPREAEQPVLVVSGPRTNGPERIAGMIEPSAPVRVAVIQPVKAAPLADQAINTPQPSMVLAALPPKPLRRPCLECISPSAMPGTARIAKAPADPAPVEAEYDVASTVSDGPVPPMPVERMTGEGSERGLIVRSGEAVISGGSQLVGTAWTLSGAAVGGLVRGVRQLTF